MIGLARRAFSQGAQKIGARKVLRAAEAFEDADLLVAGGNGHLGTRDVHVDDILHAHGLPAALVVQFKAAHDFERHAGKVETREARTEAIGAGGNIINIQARRPQRDQTLRVRDAGQQIQIGRLPVLVQVPIYLVLGTIWLLPLRRFLIWMETGRWG